MDYKDSSEQGGTQRAVHTDINTVRKNERSIRAMKRLLAVLIVLFVGLSIYVSYPFWLPKLEGVFDKPVSTVTNDGKPAAGNFPITVEENTHIDVIKDELVVSDLHTLIFYDSNGKQRASYSHDYADPSAVVKGKRVLVYDISGTGFSLFNKNGELYSKNADDKILTASLGKNGTAAIVESSDRYPSSASFYNKEGKLIYRYDCDRYITDIYIDDSGKNAYICSFASEDGAIFSQISRVELDDNGEKMVSEKLDCLALACIENESGNINVIGDNRLYTLAEDGSIKTQSEYGGELVSYSLDESCVSVLVKSGGRSGCTLLIASADEASESGCRQVADIKNGVSVTVSDDRVLLLTDTDVYSYAYSGTLAASAHLEKEYKETVYFGSAVYLLGSRGIDKIGFEM